MEIISNFCSIYCLVSFILGGGFMLVVLAIVAMNKDNEPKNKVKFFVEKYSDDFGLLMNDKLAYKLIVGYSSMFWRVKLRKEDFEDMKEGEIREVFLNLED